MLVVVRIMYWIGVAALAVSAAFNLIDGGDWAWITPVATLVTVLALGAWVDREHSRSVNTYLCECEQGCECQPECECRHAESAPERQPMIKVEYQTPWLDHFAYGARTGPKHAEPDPEPAADPDATAFIPSWKTRGDADATTVLPAVDPDETVTFPALRCPTCNTTKAEYPLCPDAYHLMTRRRCPTCKSADPQVHDSEGDHCPDSFHWGSDRSPRRRWPNDEASL